MRHKYALLWLLGTCLLTCAAFVLQPMQDVCVEMWWCPAVRQRLTLVTLLLALPLLVSLARGGTSGVMQFVRTQRMVRRLPLQRNASLPQGIAACVQRLGLSDRLDVLPSQIPEAWCYGFIWPRICVTTALFNALDAAEVEAVLRHEHHHMQRRDPLRTLLQTITDAIIWRTHTDSVQALLQRELAADRAVIDAGQRLLLARALLKLLSHPHRSEETRDQLAVTGLSVTEARIDQLVRVDVPVASAYYAPAYHVYVTGSVLLVVPIVCLLMMLVQ